MEPIGQLPVTPLGADEWRPWWEPSYTDQAMLPDVVDDQVLGYPLRAVIGRLRTRGPRGASSAAQVGWASGSVTSYGGYLMDGPAGPPARLLTEARAFSALRAARQSGCVFAALGRRTGTGLAPLRHEESETGVLAGVAFDFGLSDYVTVFDSDLIVVGGEYLQIGLAIRSVPVFGLDSGMPGHALVQAMLTADDWPWLASSP
jgi:hypothetical protein